MNYYDVLTTDEKAFLAHVSMFGSDGYPVARMLGTAKWVWYPAWGITIPMTYKTKKAAFTAVDIYLNGLMDRVGARAKELAENNSK
jgi:hypothetical protein